MRTEDELRRWMRGEDEPASGSDSGFDAVRLTREATRRAGRRRRAAQAGVGVTAGLACLALGILVVPGLPFASPAAHNATTAYDSVESTPESAENRESAGMPPDALSVPGLPLLACGTALPESVLRAEASSTVPVGLEVLLPASASQGSEVTGLARLTNLGGSPVEGELSTVVVLSDGERVLGWYAPASPGGPFALGEGSSLDLPVGFVPQRCGAEGRAPGDAPAPPGGHTVYALVHVDAGDAGNGLLVASVAFAIVP